MSESTSYLYRPQIYQTELHKEHVSFLRLGLTSYLTIPNPKNQLYYPAQLSLRTEQRLIAQLNNKEKKTQIEHLFLIVSLKLAGQNFHAELSDFKRAYPSINHSQQIDRYVEYFSKISPPIVTNTNKQSIIWQYEKLLGKANSEGYFSIPDVPVFLISTKWLEQLYSSIEVNPSPINNETLLQPVQFPLAQQKYLHYNYRVREDLRENKDYKLVSFQAWQHLFKIYGGFEIRRFTTKEREPIVEIWHVKASILIVEQRCVFHHLQIEVSKGDSFNQLLERVRLTLKKYKIVPEKYLSRTLGLFKSREMSVKEVISILQDDSHPCIVSHRFEKIADLSLEIQEARILTPHDILIVNLGSEKGIFSKISPLKVLSIRQRCLNCGTSDDLQACKCRSVFFCSTKCKDNQRGHQKECDTLVTETRKYNLVVDYYQVKRRTCPQLKNINEIGKLGFENLGNTCYMNSSLQCLIRFPDLSQFFLNNGHLKDLNVGNVLGSEGHIACAYGELVKHFYTTSRRSIEPTDILKCIAKNPQFRGYNHQDSQQFLNYFLDKLHEDLNKVRVKPYTEEIESNGRPDEVVSRMSWQNYKKRNDSFISSLLAGQYRSQIKCPDCNRVSITFDPFLSVTLQFPKPQKGQVLEGYYMTQEGQFQKVCVEVKINMPTYEFYSKYFHNPVQAAYIKDKKIWEEWNSTKSIFQNKRSTGVLFFFQQPHGHFVEIVIEFYNINKQTLEYFSRIAFAKELTSKEDLARIILLAIRKPLQKVLPKDITEEQYLNYCFEKQILKICSIKDDQNEVNEVEFPVFGVRKLIAKVELHYQKISNVSAKLNAATGSYQGLVGSLVKKLKGQLSVQQLLQCFSQPEKLTEENAWFCSVCKAHKLAEKAMSLYSLPEYLIVHLKRFNHRGDSGNRYIIYGEKVTTPIALQEFQEIIGRKYELLGIVNHFGSLMHGHYTACVKRDDWHNYDDSRCYKSKLDGKNAYLLFYKHVQ